MYGISNITGNHGYCAGQVEVQTCLVYLDNAIVLAKAFKEYVKQLKQILEVIRTAGPTLKPQKCRFGYEELTFLGHLVTCPPVPVALHPREKVVRNSWEAHFYGFLVLFMAVFSNPYRFMLLLAVLFHLQQLNLHYECDLI